MSKTLRLAASLGLVALVGGAGGAELAQAALPGKNGPIVYSHDVERGPGLNYEVFRARSDGTHPKRLTFNKRPDTDPAWSPDGSHILYERTRQANEIWVMKANATDKRRVVGGQNGSDPAWSPDGQSIAFVKEGVYTLDMTDSNAEPLLIVDEPAEGGDVFSFEDPAWSPDGARVAYVAEGDLESYVGVVDADGENDERWELSYFISGLDWSPSGHRLVTAMYDARPGDGDEIVSGWEIYTLDPDVADPPKSVRRITMNGYGEKRNRRGESKPVWSPNGGKILFSGRYGGGDGEHVTVNADFKRQPRARILTDNRNDDITPSWLARS